MWPKSTEHLDDVKAELIKREAKSVTVTSQIVWSESCVFGDPSQHLRADFILIVKGPDIVRELVRSMVQLDVGTALVNGNPSDGEKCLEHPPSLCAGPKTHAVAQTKQRDFGTSCDFSTRSAITRSAKAYALALASSSVAPYAITPGISEISAMKRPSVSRSNSIANCTSLLLTLRGGFRSDITFVGCPIQSPVACFRQEGWEKHRARVTQNWLLRYQFLKS